MNVAEAIQELRQAADRSHPDAVRAAADNAARAIAEAAGDGARATVDGIAYRVEEVTWAVSQFDDGHSAYPSPLPVPALVRGDAVLADVRTDYTDGNTWYFPVPGKIGRWRRFRMGSPGEKGYDLHLAEDEEVMAFAREVDQLVDALEVAGG